MDKDLGGRAYLVKKLWGTRLVATTLAAVLNHMFREINLALARGEEVEFVGGRLLRVDPAKLSRSRYNEENWFAHWRLWTEA